MHNSANRCLTGFGLLAAIGVGGCTAPGDRSGASAQREATDFASRHLLNVAPAEVESVARRIFMSHFRINPDASTGDTLVSLPTETEGRGQRKSIRDTLAVSPNRQRQRAELRLRPQGGNVLVLVSVQTQRLDTAERAAFARERGDDRPTETPIEREGPTSPSAREEWVNIGRDRKLEQQILSEIEQAITTTRPAGK